MTELQLGANGAFILKTQWQIHKVLKVGVKMQLELLAGARTPISQRIYAMKIQGHVWLFWLYRNHDVVSSDLILILPQVVTERESNTSLSL